MGVIQERIVAWKEGEEMLVHIYEGKNMPPLNFDTTKARISVKGEGKQSVVTMTMEYETKGLAGTLMGPMTKSQFGKAVPGLLKGLKYYVENGEKATSADLKQIPTLAAA